MDAQQFLADFGHIANAPGGVARLREMVLALAVQGRLIAQDLNGSPASELLKNITAGKRDVSKKNSKSKLPNTLSKINTSDMPFEKPQGWEWVRLGDIAEIERGGSPRPIDDFLTNDPDGLSWIKIGDTVKGSKFITSTREKIKREGLVKTRMVYPGDFLLTNSMSFGRPYITNIEGCIHDGWLRIHPPTCLEKDYLYHLLSSPFVANFFLKSAAGAVVQNLNADKVRELPVPLPPLDEQARIVAKVDELMALCDRLELQQQQRRKLQNVLRQSILQAVATATSPHELQTTWNRLANHFGQIFSAPEDILLIKSTILNLAMRGLLVEQFSEDTPADSLLADIARERQQLAATQKQKSASAIPALKEDELPYQLPKGWVWARVVDLVDVGTGATPAKSEPSYYGGDIPWYTSSATNNKFARVPETFITEKAINKTNCKVFPEGSLIVALYGQGKTRGQISELTIAGATNQALAAMVFYKSSIKVKRYLKYYFEKIYEEIRLEAEGGPQPNLNVRKIKETLVPVPPIEEQLRIVRRLDELFLKCDLYSSQLSSKLSLAKNLADVSIACLTGINTEPDEEPMKAPSTELIAPIRLGQTPNIKAQAPLATLLTRHHGEMSAKDLWQRFGGEIDAFYAQLKTEVAHGWIQEPEVAEMRQVTAERAEA